MYNKIKKINLRKYILQVNGTHFLMSLDLINNKIVTKIVHEKVNNDTEKGENYLMPL